MGKGAMVLKWRLTSNTDAEGAALTAMGKGAMVLTKGVGAATTCLTIGAGAATTCLTIGAGAGAATTCLTIGAAMGAATTCRTIGAGATMGAGAAGAIGSTKPSWSKSSLNPSRSMGLKPLGV